MIQNLILATEGRAPGFATFDVPFWIWVAFVSFIALLLFADLLIVHRKPHAISVREAAVESAVWISLGLAFALVVWWWQGGGAAGEYLAGYLIEKSLSVDNVFVWAVILAYFAVPAEYQYRVLFWGIFGALVFRGMFIFAGVTLIDRFDWILYLFGAFLIFTAWRIATHKGASVDPAANPVLRIFRRLVPSTPEYHGQRFFVKIDRRLLATPLLAVLVLVETTDVVFAVDSIPAILAVSRNPFIVFSSNAFAILGLRALYFLLAGMAHRFRYLNIGLGVILFFVGAKMIVHDWYHFPIWLSLSVITSILGATIFLSLRAERRDRAETASPPGHQPPGAG